MDANVLKYRKRHRRCKYCMYLKHRIAHANGAIDYDECVIKDRLIDYPESIPRIFCRYYTVDESRGITE